MSRTPNHEQIKAIEHTGGVLLSAGAGSGKTFVLVEHIIYLANVWKDECLQQDPLLRVSFLQKKFAEIVLMTFTKEAAGELSHRLQLRVEEEIENQSEDPYWLMVKESVTSMTLTTIHGFCAKLLSQGFFINFDPESKLLSEIEFRYKIKSLVEKWFETTKDDPTKRDFLELVISNKESLLDAFVKIFSDAKIRQLWLTLDPAAVYQDDITHILKDIFKLEEIEEALDTVCLAGFEEQSKNVWYKTLEAYNQMISGMTLSSYEEIETFLEFFKGKKLSGPPKKYDAPETHHHLDKIKRLRGLLKDYQEDFKAYFIDGKEQFINWISATHEIFMFIEDHYLSVEGINFSDYEYFVLKGLDDESTVTKIANTYKYLIIDEFQDTSQVQFDIVEKIIESDFNRLFCVGDIKQAIYGFRGGEIAVFEKCMQLIPLNLELNNNYRSCRHIINYNNKFFDHIFHKGLRFESADPFAVKVVPQVVPDEVERDYDGNVFQQRLIADLEEKEKLSNDEVSEYEADHIIKQITHLQAEFPNDEICILYSKLTPLRFLLKKLIQGKFEFISQVKINTSEDPYLSIFKHLIEHSIDTNRLEDKVLNRARQIVSYLNYLDIDHIESESVVELLEKYDRNIYSLGLYLAVESFFFEIGISNSSYQNNSELIEQICKIAMDDPSRAWLIFDENSDGNYSVKFQNGHGKINIMTTHASKGLEFDHVILAGIHTNGKGMPSRDYFGTLPGSFRWKKDLGQRKPYYSPELLLEKALQKRKEFSESKRLFYVANTRAVKTISFCQIIHGAKNATINGDPNSWIMAIDCFENGDLQVDIQEELLEQVEKLDTPTAEPLLFHMDNLGLLEKKSLNNEQTKDILACIPELSVTRLTSLSQCPTKFYLLNICKISPDEDWFTKAGLYKDDLDENLLKASEVFNESLEQDKQFLANSAMRGTQIHEALHHMVTRNMVIPRSITEKRDLNALSWAKSEIEQNVGENELISEVPVKFPFFGTMISGTPDLIVQPSKLDLPHIIVDFKTGKYSEEKVGPYWFQLEIYAYALYELDKCSRNQEIHLELWFVDEKEKYTKKVNYQDLSTHLFDFWKNIGDLSVKNTQHCESCSFGNLCHFKGDSFAEIL